MKKLNSINTFFIILIITAMIEYNQYLPWWAFVVPVVFLGMLISYKQLNIPVFLVGFVSGFIVWLAANIIFDSYTSGMILQRVGLLFSLPKIAVMLVSAIIGGILTALALYTGSCVFNKKEKSELSDGI